MCGPGNWEDRFTTTYLFSCWINISAKPVMSHHIKSCPLCAPRDCFFKNEYRSQTQLIQIILQVKVYRLLKAHLTQWASRSKLCCPNCSGQKHFECRTLSSSWGCWGSTCAVKSCHVGSAFGVYAELQLAWKWILAVRLWWLPALSTWTGLKKHMWEYSDSIHPLSSRTSYA